MCFPPEATPPPAPRQGHHVSSERLTLEADDGNRLAARHAITDVGGAPGLVLVPDIRGLHVYYEALADAFAGAGVHTVAIDPYGRTAGPEYRADDFAWQEHRAAATDAGMRSDVRSARQVLVDAGVEAVHVLGFCFGGRGALMQASQPGLAGVVAFYGPPARKPDDTSLSAIEEAERGLVRCPILGLYGGDDAGIPTDDVDAYDEALTAAGVEHELVVYPGAPHSFFDRRFAEHEEACADAWRRVLTFVAAPAGAAE